jgi:hypothetical protein
MSKIELENDISRWVSLKRIYSHNKVKSEYELEIINLLGLIIQRKMAQLDLLQIENGVLVVL